MTTSIFGEPLFSQRGVGWFNHQPPGIAKPKGQGWRGVTTARGQMIAVDGGWWWEMVKGGESHEKWSDFVPGFTCYPAGNQSHIPSENTLFEVGIWMNRSLDLGAFFCQEAKNEGKWGIEIPDPRNIIILVVSIEGKHKSMTCSQKM